MTDTNWDDVVWDDEKGEFVPANPQEEEFELEAVEAKDAEGKILKNGDNVCPIKDLKVKGMSKTLKRGETIKGIKLTTDPDLIECKIGKSVLVLKTEYFKKLG